MPLTGEKKRAYDRAWNAKRRAEALVGAACARCGSTADLELDHIDPATKVDHRIWTWSKRRRDAEISKCQWLCARCHQDKSAIESSVAQRKHGTRREYEAGCRCDECVSGRSRMNRLRREWYREAKRAAA